MQEMNLFLNRDSDEEYIEQQKNHIDELDQEFRRKQAQLDHLAKAYKNSKLTTGVSIKSLKNKSKLLDEMLKEGRVNKQVKSPKVVNNLTKILSTDEINKKFQKLCEEGKFLSSLPIKFSF